VSETLDRLQSAIADRYRVERELGAGGMATVFLAQDLKHEREVAIKVLHPELGASIGSERFDREIRLAAKLQHPHILGLYDSGEANGLLYYVMPFVKGESLRDRLDRESQLPIEDAIHIALEVADALGYAHERGVVHRDIKPENILLANGHCLVADFGIARAATEAGEKLTQTGMAVGTPLYMSPEQSMGDAVGPTADIYSLGCVLYEMLAGTPPFTGPNARAIMARHAMTPVPGLQEVRASVPDEVEEAVMAALAKVPADRPQTAKAFCEIMGTPLGATATRRANIRVTSTRNPTAGQRMTLEQFEALKAAEVAAKPSLAKRPVVWAAAALMLIGLGVGYWKLRPGTGAVVPGGPDPHDIAVLYFEDQSPNHDLGYLADGLTEGLISALSSVPGLSVVSKGGVGEFRGGSISRDSIARALEVGTLVMGSVEPERDSIRVTIRMLDDAGTELDKATFKKPANDLIALSDSLSQEAAVLIRRRIGVEAQLRKTRLGTRSTEAWAMYQRALLARRRGDSLYKAGDAAGFVANYHAADSTAQLAQRLDDKWTDPVVLRGQLDYWRSRRATDDAGLARAEIDSGLARAAEALALDKNDADALELRGSLNYWKYLNPFEPDSSRRRQLLTGAQQDLEAATRLNPSAASAYAMLSHLYSRLPDKQMTDVLLAANKALDMDAYLSNADVVIYRLALGYYDLGQGADADKWCAEGRRRFPADPRFVQCQLQIMTSKFVVNPDPALAWRLSDSVVALTPDDKDRRYTRLYTRVLVAGVLARAGQLDSARHVLTATKPDPEVDPSNDLANTAAFAWLLAGDTTKALDQIKLYLLTNPDRLVDFRDNVNWWFRGLSEDPRYKAIVGLKQ
jgi:eukaryotic-like serine/threonine-protein kinase